MPAKNIAREGRKQPAKVGLLLQFLLQLAAAAGAALAALFLNDCPIQVLFRRKVAEDNGLVHSGLLGDLTGCRAFVALMREGFSSYKGATTREIAQQARVNEAI